MSLMKKASISIYFLGVNSNFYNSRLMTNMYITHVYYDYKETSRN